MCQIAQFQYLGSVCLGKENPASLEASESTKSYSSRWHHRELPLPWNGQAPGPGLGAGETCRSMLVCLFVLHSLTSKCELCIQGKYLSTLRIIWFIVFYHSG